MRPPDKLEKPPVGADGSKKAPRSRIAFTRTYRASSHRASQRHLRLVSGGSEDAALERACTEIRQHRSRLPLWALRLGAWAGTGRLRWQHTFDALLEAGIAAGGSEHWVRRCIYHGFAQSNIATKSTPRLAELAQRGLS